MAHKSAAGIWWRQHLFYPLQTLIARLVFGVFATLPPESASALGGWLGRRLGPWTGGHRTALHNLARALPELSPQRRHEIVRGMWDDLGRVLGEYPHLAALSDFGPGGALELVGAEHFMAMRDDGRAGLLFGGHLGNWELAGAVAMRLGVELTLVYRAPNNPSFDKLLQRLRRPAGNRHIPKGGEGAKALLKALLAGGHIGLLVDQKMNDGIAVPFFGREAMTAPAVAQFALRYRIPLAPMRIERLGGARFRLTVYPPLDLPDSGNREADIRTLMQTVNALLESWIRERPEQWLWLHRRWSE